MGLLKCFLIIMTLSMMALPVVSAAQDAAETNPRAETGGATTLEDILRRQRGEEVDMDFRRSGPDRDRSASLFPSKRSRSRVTSGDRLKRRSALGLSGLRSGWCCLASLR